MFLESFLSDLTARWNGAMANMLKWINGSLSSFELWSVVGVHSSGNTWFMADLDMKLKARTSTILVWINMGIRRSTSNGSDRAAFAPFGKVGSTVGTDLRTSIFLVKHLQTRGESYVT